MTERNRMAFGVLRDRQTSDFFSRGRGDQEAREREVL